MALFRLRLEQAIKELKPTPITANVDPTTDFWNAYKKLADEYDDNLLGKYTDDLDTSLLFVSTSTLIARLAHPQPLLFLC